MLTPHRWAWQNPHVTLHIPPEARLQHAAGKKISGQPKRPRHSVSSLLSNLHLLLRVPSFSGWPLEIRFFSEDVHKAWLKWTNVSAHLIRDSIPIITDFPPESASASGSDGDGSPRAKKRKITHGIAALDVDYTDMKAQVEKGKDIVEFEREGACAICHKDLEHDGGIYTICPSAGCESVTHMTCLSKHFLKGDKDALVPILGRCPSCKAELKWIDVVKELSLRLRGQKEVDKLLKVKRAKKGKAANASQAVVDSDIESDDDELDDDLDELRQIEALNPAGGRMDMGDSWNAIDDTDNSDAESTTSTGSRKKKVTSRQACKPALRTVIEDSDWDDAEILD
jgi:structure-specific endonuclease subunit SLX1